MLDLILIEKKLLDKMLNIMPNDIGSFWNDIMSLENDMFRHFYREDDKTLNNLVTKKEIYNEIKLILNSNDFDYQNGNIGRSKITFKCCDIFKVFSNFNMKYDFINFSNIYNYVDKKQYIKFLKYIIENFLNVNGNILLNYSWDNINDSNLINDLKANKIRLNYRNDEVYIYTKK